MKYIIAAFFASVLGFNIMFSFTSETMENLSWLYTTSLFLWGTMSALCLIILGVKDRALPPIMEQFKNVQNRQQMEKMIKRATITLIINISLLSLFIFYLISIEWIPSVIIFSILMISYANVVGHFIKIARKEIDNIQ